MPKQLAIGYFTGRKHCGVPRMVEYLNAIAVNFNQHINAFQLGMFGKTMLENPCSSAYGRLCASAERQYAYRTCHDFGRAAMFSRLRR